MASDTVTETSSAIRPLTRSALGALERVSAEMRELIQAGAASKNATTSQKFAFGDRVTELFVLLAAAEEQAALTEESRSFLELCRSRRDELLEGNQVSRGTLVNYGKISRVFGPAHDIRKGSLPFSFAKTLSSLEDAGDRDYWYEQALLRKMSVNQLQEELSSRRGPGSGITNRRKQSKAFVCAQTKLAITEDDLKTMIVVQPPSAGSSAARVAGPAKTLRFRDMAALADWIQDHNQEYPQARSREARSVGDAAVNNESDTSDPEPPIIAGDDVPDV